MAFDDPRTRGYNESMNADEIRALRKRLQLTQERFAQRLGVALRTVEDWEAGRRSPHGLYLKAVERVRRQAEKEGKS